MTGFFNNRRISISPILVSEESSFRLYYFFFLCVRLRAIARKIPMTAISATRAPAMRAMAPYCCAPYSHEVVNEWFHPESFIVVSTTGA
jgi:hypothetical protein